MSGASISSQIEAREQIEGDLFEEVLKRKSEWLGASGQERDAARQRFMDALRSFNAFVLDGEVPNR